MSERTSAPGRGTGAHTEANVPGHHLTITTVPMPAGNPLRASCNCGWQSEIVTSVRQVRVAAQNHLSSAATSQTDMAAGRARSSETCPWWCANPAHDGDGFDSSAWDDDEILFRDHVYQFTGASVAVVQEEKRDHGVTTWGTVKIRVYEEPRTPDEARSVARHLGPAAALLERIQAGQNPRSPHAPWCEDDTSGVFCGHGTDCYWDSDQQLGRPAGYVDQRHQSAKEGNRGYEHSFWMSVTMSRNFAAQHRQLEDGTDDYVVTLIAYHGDEPTEHDMTVPEARKLIRILTSACDVAWADRLAVR